MKKLLLLVITSFLFWGFGNVTAQEMIMGGDMESDEYWTIVDIAAGNGHTETFGYLDDSPTGGSDGCLSLAGLGNWSNAAACQEITLTKGVAYKISMLVKTSYDFVPESNWAEIVIVPQMPVVDSDITSHPNVFALNSWDCSDVTFVDGNFADYNCDAKSALNDDLYFEGSGDTTVVLVLKVGGNTEYNVLFDNVSVMGTNVAVESATNPSINNVYPNPATDHIRISNLKANEVQIFDIVGKKVYSTNNVEQEMQIDISGYAEGMYIVRLGETTRIFIKE